MDLKLDHENEPLVDAPEAAAAVPRRTRARALGAAAAALLVGAAAVARGVGRGAPAAAPLQAGAVRVRDAGEHFESIQTLKDISGMGYVGEGTFVAVHDAKADEDPSFQRVSLLQIPYDLVPGLQWMPVHDINWPTDREISVKNKSAPTAGPNDLESVSTIPGGGGLFLFCESTNSREDTPVADRIYLAEVEVGPAPGVTIKDHTAWSTFADTVNVEATAVAKLDDGALLFFWGERDELTIKWTDLSLEPELAIGQGGVAGEGSFTLENVHRYNRPIVGLDVDEVTGEIYLVSSNDNEGGAVPFPPGLNADNGPYWSMTSTIGRVDLATGKVTVYATPERVTHQDGFKVETVARAQVIAPFEGHTFNTSVPATFIGTDDENYGGTLRKLEL